jgi:hypothetical protein
MPATSRWGRPGEGAAGADTAVREAAPLPVFSVDGRRVRGSAAVAVRLEADLRAASALAARVLLVGAEAPGDRRLGLGLAHTTIVNPGFLRTELLTNESTISADHRNANRAGLRCVDAIPRLQNPLDGRRQAMIRCRAP